LDILGTTCAVMVAHFLALLSPGPDFVLIVKSAIKNGDKKTIGVPAGIATANAIYIILCLAGISSILAKSVTLLLVLKITGGLFLIYLSIMALKTKKSSYKSLESISANGIGLKSTFFREYVTGFLSGILNPKNLLFYLGLFTVVLTQDVGLTFKICLGVWMTSIVFIWDVSIVFLLSANKVRQKFTKISFFIDKCTGSILGLIGVSIVKSAWHSP